MHKIIQLYLEIKSYIKHNLHMYRIKEVEKISNKIALWNLPLTLEKYQQKY